MKTSQAIAIFILVLVFGSGLYFLDEAVKQSSVNQVQSKTLENSKLESAFLAGENVGMCLALKVAGKSWKPVPFCYNYDDFDSYMTWTNKTITAMAKDK